jgi:hypothetical protein
MNGSINAIKLPPRTSVTKFRRSVVINNKSNNLPSVMKKTKRSDASTMSQTKLNNSLISDNKKIVSKSKSNITKPLY